MATRILMPRLSLTMKKGSIIQWFKSEGETVQKGDPIVEVLSEKVTYDIEAPTSGVLRKVLVPEGVEASVGQTLALIAAPNEELPEEEKIPKATELTTVEEPRLRDATSKRPILASPAAKRLAKEHSVDLTLVNGSGPEARISEKDIKAFLASRELTPAGIMEEIELTGVRRTTAERVTSSFQTAPHSFIVMNVDMTVAEEVKQKIQCSFTAMIISAVAKALQKHRIANSKLAGNIIQIFQDINIGVAVSTETGLLVPVIRNADKKKLLTINSELKGLVEMAKQGKLSRNQLTGGTFTVTNLGMYDVSSFIPIINPPEAAILAAGKTQKTPVVIKDKVAIKQIMTLTLGYDHRILDGAPAAMFLSDVKKHLETADFTM